MRASFSAGLLAVIVFSVLASGARSQWTVTYLHPEGAPESFGTGVSGVDQVGYIDVEPSINALPHAARWTGSASSFVDMNPPGASYSQILGTDGIHQSGWFRHPPTIPPSTIIPARAAIWSGTAQSFVDLHPRSFPYDWQASKAAAVEGNLATGDYTGGESFPTGATTWNVNTGSTIPIPWSSDPYPSYIFSYGLGTDGVSVVGRASKVFGCCGPFHAFVSNLHSNTFMDLHPPEFRHSEAADVEGAIQVGHVSNSEFGNGPTRAALWTGTAASFVDMNPSGADGSALRGADGGYQVGYAAFSGSDNAGIWSGTPDSFTNLHSFLAPSYSRSQARGVWTDNYTLRVVGEAFNSNLDRNEAILWELKLRDPPPQIGVPTVPVGNPGNPADKRHTGLDPFHVRTGVGAVDHEFRMGTTEVTNAQYVGFLNAVATASDPYGLYNEQMSLSPWGGIERSGEAPNFTYSVKAPAQEGAYTFEDKPVVYVSAGDAMRFANWLHNGQPLGSEGTGTTEDGAYTLNGATTDWELAGTTRNAGGKWILPTEDEWYKAAYHKNDGVTANYWDYPTADDAEPDNVEPAFDSGNSANFHRFDGDGFSVTDADAYIASRSAYGTFGQAGNVSEWTETMYPGVDDQGQRYRYFVVRGGGWHSGAWALYAGGWEYDPAAYESHNLGFRVASIAPLFAPNGDFNGDGSVDTADYVWWRENHGSQQAYNTWRANFGTHPGTGGALASAVPEPHASTWLLLLSVCWILVQLPRRAAQCTVR